eukprot:GDKJ01045025.1.p1 GENE.GDKJ01045025.1~~GDKJ01045025.1.p1  ORF type:complete len:404 (+),score=80.69 GDKJ01045025.1:36-1214(+)
MRSQTFIRSFSRFSTFKYAQCRFMAGAASSTTMAKIDSKNLSSDFSNVPFSPIRKVQTNSPVVAPWFPLVAKDIDSFSKSTMDAGVDLEADHPGFADKNYRARREQIAEIARVYKGGERIPDINYTDAENATWSVVWDKLTDLYEIYACKEFNDAFKHLQSAGIYSRDKIPQLQAVSDFCKARSGFTIRPVTGLLSGRDFLNALAFRVFFSTQYIRHHSVPLFTPEPDVCHELMGHAPLFAIPEFADFCQVIGLASLGASEEQLKQLATLFWFSVEFGMLYEGGEDRVLKAYGAGLLSSFGELQHACVGGSERNILPWDPHVACKQTYPITKYQPVYFAAESLEDAKVKMLSFCAQLDKGFNVKMDNLGRIVPDREICFRDVPSGSEAKSIC